VKIAVSDKTRRASAATLEAVAAVLDGGDYYPYVPPKDEWSDENAGPIRAFAWPLLIQAGGLAQLAGSRLQLTKAGRKALAEPAASTLRVLWQKWANTPLIDEFSRIDFVKGQTGKGKHGLTAVAARREALGIALAECPTGRWIATDELPYFSRYDGLMYFRINALGAYCLGSSDAYEAVPVERSPVLRVLPTLEVAAVGAALDPADVLALDAYAVRMSPRVWQLRAGKQLAASEEGRSAAEVREFLTARSVDPLPDTVPRLLEDIANRGERLQDRGLARLIECADPALAALIANDARTRKLCLQAGDRHLVVPAASEASFRRALRELGYLLAPSNGAAEKTRARPAGNEDGGPLGEE